jgi:phenylacetate-CoA ligase
VTFDRPRYADLPTPAPGSAGMVWPTVPEPQVARLIALQYQLEDSEWWPAEIIERLQMRQLEQLLRHAGKTVPFHAKRLAVLNGLKAGELTLDHVRDIPVLRRAELQEHGDALLSRQPPRDHGKPGVIRTSGSTGRPIAVTRTPVSQLFFNALNLRYHVWHERDFMARNASIRALRGAHAQAAKQGKGLPWVPGYPCGEMFFQEANDPIEVQLDWLCAIESQYLVVYPSVLRELLALSERTGKVPATLREVTTMAEMLDPALRGECQRIWGAALHDLYSSQEMGLMALECPAAPHYHVQSESVLLEVLDDRGRPCGPGQVGRIVATDLHNFAMPLIRYEVGDYAEVGEPCACGRGLPVLTRIFGRYRNLLVAPDGRRFLPGFTDLVKDVMAEAPVRQAQLVQRQPDSVDFRVVAAEALSDDQVKAIAGAVAKRIPAGMAVNVVAVDAFTRPDSGKFEDVVCAIDPAAATPADAADGSAEET